MPVTLFSLQQPPCNAQGSAWTPSLKELKKHVDVQFVDGIGM